MSRSTHFLVSALLLALIFTGCAAPAPAAPTATPVVVARTDTEEIVPTVEPTEEPTVEPTPEPTATPTQPPTATPQPEAAASDAVAQATPTVVIPANWPVYTDQRLGYSVAHPGTWLQIDLRGDSFQSLARLFGAGAAAVVDDLEAFLETPAGESIGIVVVEPDVTQLFSSAPFPAFLNVSVIDLPEGVTAEQLQAVLESNVALFGAVTVESSTVETINNLPAIHITARADLTEVGFPVTAYLEEVGLVANDKLYILTLASKANLAERKRAAFNGIIGSFRPE